MPGEPLRQLYHTLEEGGEEQSLAHSRDIADELMLRVPLRLTLSSAPLPTLFRPRTIIWLLLRVMMMDTMNQGGNLRVGACAKQGVPVLLRESQATPQVCASRVAPSAASVSADTARVLRVPACPTRLGGVEAGVGWLAAMSS